MDDDVYELLFDSSEEEEMVQPIQRRRKVYKLRINFSFQSDWETRERFRMSAAKLEELCVAIGGELHNQSKGGALTSKQILCVALHWLGSGCQYHAVGDMHGVSKATVCRCVKTVVSAVNRRLLPHLVQWPNNIAADIHKFSNVANFPQCCGVIDGMLVTIDAPSENEAGFVDRHGNHSLNCMFVCGPTCIFYFVSARWPGSVHDGRVLRTSTLFQTMEAGNVFPNAVLLGDSGYPLKSWLMTPLNQNPNDIGERRYNRRLKATRQTVERSLGILKEKFPCLNHLRLDPTYAGTVVTCCTTLCNFARMGEEDNEVVQIDENQYDEPIALEPQIDDNGRPVPEAVLRQRQIINSML